MVKKQRKMKKILFLTVALLVNFMVTAQTVSIKKSQSYLTINNSDHSDDYPSTSIRFYYNSNSASIFNVFNNQAIIVGVPYSKIINTDVSPNVAFTDSTSLKAYIRSGFFVAASDTTGITAKSVDTFYNKSFVNTGTPAPVTNIIEAWGDSRTQGVTVIGTSPATDHPYTTKLASLSGYTVNNHGIAGYTSAQVKALFLAQTTTQLNHPQLIWCGYNDLSTGTQAQFDTLKLHIAQMVAKIPHESYIIIGEDPDWSNPVSSQNLYPMYQNYNTYMAKTYGRHFFNVNAYLLARYNRSLSTDAINVGFGKLPPSLSVDGVHETAPGYDTIATGLYKHINVLDFKPKQFTPDYPRHVLRTLEDAQGTVQSNDATFDNVNAFSINLPKDGNIRQGRNIVFRSDSVSLGTVAGALNGVNYIYPSGVNIPTIFGEGNLPNASGNYPVVFGWQNYTSLTTGANNLAIGWAAGATLTSCSGCAIMGYNLNFPSTTANGQIDFFNALFMTGSSYSGTTVNSGKMGLFTPAPNSTLQINGSTSYSYVEKTAAYTLTTSDRTVNFTTGTENATLPTAVGITGREYIINNSGTGTVTTNTTSSQTINGATTFALAQNKYVHVLSTGANWIIVANN
jgi:lysophospholipase L1-like esterase